MSLNVSMCGIEFKNPVTTASGTFGSGIEFSDFFDISKLGAVTVKGVSAKPWDGNLTPRVYETYGGMINAVGLQNPGAQYFIENDLKFLKSYDTKVIVNICGKTVEEYVEVAKMLTNEAIDMFELNISCPNVKSGGAAFGTDKALAKEVTKEVKAVINKPLIVKLSPNVTSITEIATAVADGGADAISLINTLLGMAIDIKKKKAILANTVGGLSGPAIKPVALRMVYQVCKEVDLPVIGMGGISTWKDAIEFIMAGATFVSVGCASFKNPYAAIEIIDGIEDYMKSEGIKDLSEIRGIIK